MSNLPPPKSSNMRKKKPTPPPPKRLARPKEIGKTETLRLRKLERLRPRDKDIVETETQSLRLRRLERRCAA